MNKAVKEILSTAVYLAGVMAVTFLVIHFVAQRTVVIGSSMYPTLEDGDSLITEKVTYRFRDPQRFDIIVFPYQYEKDVNYIKRVIGLPGETVQIDGEGNIFIDGEILEEDYGRETILDPGLAAEPIMLAEDEYFVMGDNRNNSSDSRAVSVQNIHREDIEGRAWVRIWPLSRFGVLEHQ